MGRVKPFRNQALFGSSSDPIQIITTPTVFVITQDSFRHPQAQIVPRSLHFNLKATDLNPFKLSLPSI